jgi:peptidoglycan/LPS O-acetylase OafA/YrhL
LALAVVIGIASTYITMGVQHHIAPCLVYNCFDAFGIGSMYAYARSGSFKVQQFERTVRALACAGIAIYFYWKLSLFYGYQPACLFLEKTVDSIICAWLIILVINNKTAWVKRSFLENKALNFTGKISFGIYLYHAVYLNGLYNRVNIFLDKLTHHHPSLNAVVLARHYNYWIHIAIILLIATASYLLLEQPMLKLKKIFSYKKPTFATTANTHLIAKPQ